MQALPVIPETIQKIWFPYWNSLTLYPLTDLCNCMSSFLINCFPLMKFNLSMSKDKHPDSGNQYVKILLLRMSDIHNNILYSIINNMISVQALAKTAFTKTLLWLILQNQQQGKFKWKMKTKFRFSTRERVKNFRFHHLSPTNHGIAW